MQTADVQGDTLKTLHAAAHAIITVGAASAICMPFVPC